ncbi:MAG: Fic family protein, partial [Rickettsiales bacterium]|nr:Fic family protein [Rickettsiales bacterium]
PNQDILISNIVLREAQDSSAIENIFTTSDVLYKADITPESQLDSNTKEVRSYNAALWFGMKLIASKPLSTSVFEAIVQKIKSNTAGIRTTPGTKIINQTTGEAVHIPPQTESEIRNKLKNLEDFLYLPEYSEIDAIIKMAVMHYQFEAIHPFSDGNGRTGRIINILWLVQEKLLDRPILFLSGYFLRNRNDYYKKLAKITSEGDWEGWIIYILNGVIETSRNTCELIDKIIKLRERYQNEIQKYFPKIYSFDLIDSMFMTPYFRLSDFSGNMKTIGEHTASKYLHLLSEPYQREDGTTGQVLQMYRQGRENIYFNKDLFEALSGSI